MSRKLTTTDSTEPKPIPRDPAKCVAVAEPDFGDMDAAWEIATAAGATRDPLLTEHNTRGICWQTSNGMPLRYSAPLYKVPAKIAQSWVARGDQWEEQAAKSGSIEVSPALLPYCLFWQRYRYHEAVAVMLASESLYTMAEDWRAKQNWLAARYPDIYGKTVKQEHSGSVQTAQAYVPVRNSE